MVTRRGDYGHISFTSSDKGIKKELHGSMKRSYKKHLGII
jgi:hypothetical protein